MAKKRAILSKLLKRRVEAATVQLTKLGGRGVLVPGGFILTTAHCIEWDGKGRMVVRGDYFVADVKTASGLMFLMEVAAAEPVSDIAALREADNQLFDEDAELLEQFVSATEPVPLYDSVPEPGGSIPVHVFTHDKGWIMGNFERKGASGHDRPMSGFLWRVTEKDIVGGTSGSPIIAEDGRLIGIASNGMGHDPVPFQALPCWLRDQILAATLKKKTDQ